MAAYCRVCGRPMEGGDDFCETCKESIRAEALGKHRKIAKETRREGGTVGVRDKNKREGMKHTVPSPPSQNEETPKKPHHFKSMAEYLEYLKEKEG